MSEEIENKPVKKVKGVGTTTAKKLEDRGADTVLGLAQENARELSEETSVGEGKAQNIIQNARDMLHGGDRFSTGKEVEERQENMEQISTGSEDLDGILKGGVPTNYITEAYGAFSSGKTQLAHQLTVNCINELDQDVVFIDTEETFRTDRIKQMAEANGQDPDKVLERVQHTSPEDTDDMIQITEEVKSTFDLNNDFGLIVVDSIIAPFRAEYSGREEMTERQNKLGDVLKKLSKLAGAYDLAVFYTNQAYSDPGQMFGDPTNPSGGNVLGHRSSFRLYMNDRGKKGWSAELVDSPNLPQEECMFNITNEGIRDT